METNYSALLILLGSFLTFSGTWFVEDFKNKREKKEREVNYKLLAKQELRIVVKILDTLKTTLDHKNYYEINIRGRLSSSRYTLEGYRKDAIYLSAEGLQERFIDIVSNISDYHANIDSLQKLFWSEQKKVRDKQKTETPSDKEGVSVESPESAFKDEEHLNRFFNETKLQYSIEHVELRRQIEEMIKELEK